MKQLEDKIKERLKGYESCLPEGDLSRFKALLDEQTGAGRRRGVPAWIIPVAAAAGIALFFIFRPVPEAGKIQAVDNPSLIAENVVPIVDDRDNGPVTFASNLPAVPVRKVQQVPEDVVESNSESTPVSAAVSASTAATTTTTTTTTSSSSSSIHDEQSSPFVPQDIDERNVPENMKASPALIGVIGGSGVIALAGILPSLVKTADAQPFSIGETTGNAGTNVDNPLPAEKNGNNTHYLPFRAGLSLRIPFDERWSLTTGVSYSLYSSKIGYANTSSRKQTAHYVGIPIRADYIIVGNRLLDVYAGAGAAVDFCAAAYEDGLRIAGDGIGFSLEIAGGVQFKITERLGLFLDPSLSWNIPSSNRMLDTYRSEHPLMFSVSTGLRFTVPMKR